MFTHPDKNDDKRAKPAFEKASLAYNVLKDKGKRDEYDEILAKKLEERNVLLLMEHRSAEERKRRAREAFANLDRQMQEEIDLLKSQIVMESAAGEANSKWQLVHRECDAKYKALHKRRESLLVDMRKQQWRLVCEMRSAIVRLAYNAFLPLKRSEMRLHSWSQDRPSALPSQPTIFQHVMNVELSIWTRLSLPDLEDAAAAIVDHSALSAYMMHMENLLERVTERAAQKEKALQVLINSQVKEAYGHMFDQLMEKFPSLLAEPSQPDSFSRPSSRLLPEAVERMPLRELKAALRERGINYKDCIEKRELVALLSRHERQWCRVEPSESDGAQHSEVGRSKRVNARMSGRENPSAPKKSRPSARHGKEKAPAPSEREGAAARNPSACRGNQEEGREPKSRDSTSSPDHLKVSNAVLVRWPANNRGKKRTTRIPAVIDAFQPGKSKPYKVVFEDLKIAWVVRSAISPMPAARLELFPPFLRIGVLLDALDISEPNSTQWFTARVSLYLHPTRVMSKNGQSFRVLIYIACVLVAAR